MVKDHQEIFEKIVKYLTRVTKNSNKLRGGENELLQCENTGQVTVFSILDQLSQKPCPCVKSPNPDGFTVDDIRSTVKLRHAFERAGQNSFVFDVWQTAEQGGHTLRVKVLRANGQLDIPGVRSYNFSETSKMLNSFRDRSVERAVLTPGKRIKSPYETQGPEGQFKKPAFLLTVIGSSEDRLKL